MNKIIAFLAILVLVVMSQSCSRSMQYERDRVYGERGNFSSRGMDQEKQKKLLDGFGPKKRVFVMGFINETPIGGADLERFVTDEFDRQFRYSKKSFIPEDVDVSDKPVDYFNGDRIDLPKMVARGRRLGLQVVVLGKIRKVAFRMSGDDIGLLRQSKSVALATIDIYMIDVQSGKVLFNETKTGDSSDRTIMLFSDTREDNREYRMELIEAAIRSVVVSSIKLMRRKLDRISWEGRIARIVGNKYFINAGKASGLNIGDVLKVMTPGEDIYDPDTGLFIGHAPGQVKGTLEIIEYLGVDGGVCVVHSGGQFEENDIVQLY